MITRTCFDKYKIDNLKTVKNNKINDLYQEARGLDDKLFLYEIEYTYGFFKKKKEYKYTIEYRYIPYEFFTVANYNERETLTFLVGYIQALKMVKYWEDPIKVKGWNFTDEEVSK